MLCCTDPRKLAGWWIGGLTEDRFFSQIRLPLPPCPDDRSNTPETSQITATSDVPTCYTSKPTFLADRFSITEYKIWSMAKGLLVHCNSTTEATLFQVSASKDMHCVRVVIMELYAIRVGLTVAPV